MSNYLDYDDRAVWSDETDDVLQGPLFSRVARWAGAAFLAVAVGLAIWALLAAPGDGAYAMIDEAAAPRQASWGPVVVAAVGGVLMLAAASLLDRHGRSTSHDA